MELNVFKLSQIAIQSILSIYKTKNNRVEINDFLSRNIGR